MSDQSRGNIGVRKLTERANCSRLDFGGLLRFDKLLQRFAGSRVFGLSKQANGWQTQRERLAIIDGEFTRAFEKILQSVAQLRRAAFSQSQQGRAPFGANFAHLERLTE